MMTFQQASCQAAQRFLQTIVIVDNRAMYGAPTLPEPTDTLEDPDDLDTINEAAPELSPTKASDAPLNAQAVSEAFASEGLVCSILKPTAENPLSGPAITASERADLLVLDWEMEDSGELASAIARGLLAKDAAEGGKLRLIAIYTGRAPLSDVRSSFKRRYDDLNRNPDSAGHAPELDMTGDGLSVGAGHARIIFISKNKAAPHDPEAQYSVPEDELPKYLTSEFAAFAGGLLPNATLAGIAELRRKTHRMLARFDKSLDGPILTNRALNSEKGEAEEIVGNLILAELDGQVPLGRIATEYLGKDSVRAFLKAKIEGGHQPTFMKDADGKQLEPLNLDQTCALIENGLSAFSDKVLEAQAKSVDDDLEPYKKKVSASLHKRLYGLLGTVKSGRDAHHRFAIVSMMRRDITGVESWADTDPPAVKLGTIIAREGKYWVCLTPLCDCVRLTPGSAGLLFTQLHGDGSSFEFVVPKDRKAKAVAKLRTRTKEMQLVTLNFSNVVKGQVVATIQNDNAVFSAWPLGGDQSQVNEYSWVGELKPMRAQQLVQNFAANMGRVGLDENEWHRLHAVRS
ncbi:response regulator receiver domain [Brevundimonas sp.]|uniref:response regulator receiver domain n=1 Tax=Brevundimonas sp. TaxID=1871086 RepID=UPI003AF744C3